ncbi:unnamed protein product [Brachionus calyciflorus]|uniref:Uncharacterized protein n=1 Tax=Brachionus calyciflorus TaxID=104777 RepID=A0A814MJL5_9BILA|nr:unnamed protein product [Brachionus calyciflorus]
MTYQTSQNQTQSNKSNLKNLENRLQQDLLAYKKVIKLAKTIETRIYRTRVQIENVKQHKFIETINEQSKASSKIPCVPIKPIKSNFTQNTQNQELNLTILNDESKQIVKLQIHSMNEQVKKSQNKNLTNSESLIILTTSVSD